MRLDGLSVGELEALQERVSKEITKRLCERVDLKSFEFEPCDDRSMGSLKFSAGTKHGLLTYSSNLGNGYTDDVETLLDGEEVGCLDLDLPSFHDNTSQDEARQAVLKAVLAFEAEEIEGA